MILLKVSVVLVAVFLLGVILRGLAKSIYRAGYLQAQQDRELADQVFTCLCLRCLKSFESKELKNVCPECYPEVEDARLNYEHHLRQGS